MNRSKELAKNTIIISIGTFLPKLAAIITLPIITSQLTKEEYGTYDLFSSFVALLLPIVTLQIQSGLFRFLIDCRDNPEEKKRLISTVYCTLIPICFISVIVLIVAFHGYPFIFQILFISYVITDIVITFTRQIVRGLSENKLYSLSAIVRSLINMIFIILLVGLIKEGLNGVLLSFIIATMVSTSIMLIKVDVIKNISISFWSRDELKRLLIYSLPMIPNVLSSWVLNVSDRFVIKGFIGIEAVAVYAAANKIPQIVTSVQGTFTYAWQENASLTLKDEDVDSYYSSIFDRVFCIMAGVMALIIGFSPVLFFLLIKGDYSDAYPQMSILYLSVLFAGLSTFMGGIYIAHKKTLNVGVTTLIAALINILIDLGLIGQIGIYAASISTLVSYGILTTYRMVDVKRFQSITYKKSKIIISITVLAGMCLINWINILYLNILNAVMAICLSWILNQSLVIKLLGEIKHKIQKRNDNA